ncbi:site-specific DNA-methyltransferase [Selenihalanaerobacter shriftii]|uniref:Site-specific DNA-methyltransferase (Adenine-specific) n=1 Tax=Selenihalanaerobacter shriftii TaxID=142842 RepID=A0A1T4QG70_9FIRM|nr:site-specific DNA-methyltransferase [Selenihalanaerobacter shriftii]SKA02702.1 site-specific DNA-methyltransferase (adenine-specific) [Selenihalanaerobacter shriftii]
MFLGDNRQVLAYLLNGYQKSIDLIYIDPPFSSNRDYNKSIKLKNTDLDIGYTFVEEKQYNDKWKLEEYLQFMYERLQIMKELLSEKGSIFLHLDWRMDSYLRVMLDEIFKPDNFINRIVWKATNSSKSQTKGLGKQHNSILWYAKDKDSMTWNQVYRPPTKEYKARFTYNDNDGRGLYQTVPLVARGVQNTPNRKSFEFNGVVDKWLYSKEKLEEWWEDNRIHETRGGNYRKKVYLKDCDGPPVSDIWVDKGVAPIQKEAYPTQKPESLLERIIELASDEGNIVGDFFCGSGTTLSVAEKLNRRWIGADINKVAVQTTRDRILNLNSEVDFKVSTVSTNKLYNDVENESGLKPTVNLKTKLVNKELTINVVDFYSPELIEKLQEQQQDVEIQDFIQVISSVHIDFNYKGTFNPTYIQTDKIEKEIQHSYQNSGNYQVAIQLSDILGHEVLRVIKVDINED